jgi:hypothetical protein
VLDIDALADIAGPIKAVAHSPLNTVGYTAARHELLTLTLRTGARQQFVLKRVQLATDWTAHRTSDELGREAALLSEPTLGDIWTAFHCPYIAVGSEHGEIVLVMEDLSPFLQPQAVSIW